MNIFDMEKRPSIMNPEWKRERRDKGIREVPPDILEWAGTQEFRDSNGVFVFCGFYIIDVIDRSPGAVAGLKQWDFVLSLDDEPVSVSTFSQLLHSVDGIERTLRVRRQNGSIQQVKVKPAWNTMKNRWEVGVQMMEVNQGSVIISEGKEHHRIPFELDVGSGGKVRGYAEVSKSDDVREPARVLSRYVLFFNGKDGQLMEVDLLERWKISKNECVIDPELLSAGLYDFRKRRIYMNPFVASLAPHVLAHERRHADQELDPRLKRVLDSYLYVSVNDDNYDNDAYWTEKIRSGGWPILADGLIAGGIADTVEESTDLLQSVLERFDRYDNATQEVRRLQRSGQSQIGGQLPPALEEQQQAKDSLPDANTEIVEGLKVRDILRLPTLVIERDAEYRALVALRSLNEETGINFLGSTENTFMEMNSSASLQTIRKYMDRIGVSIPCVRALRGKAQQQRKGKQKVQGESV